MAFTDIYAKLKLDNKQFEQKLGQSKSQVSSMGATFGKLGGAIAAAFSVKKIYDFGSQLADISVDVKNVDNAFARLGITIDSLRKATGGMIDDMQLKKMSIQAQNLGLDVKQLATFFKFATIRAAETGQSVDYLVNSIVTGIGRKSVLIMDNLGISSVALQEEVKKVGDFSLAAANIINRELGKSDTSIQDTVKSSVRLSSSWKNFVDTIAKSGVSSIFDEMNNSAATFLDTISGKGGLHDIDLTGKTLEQLAVSLSHIQEQLKFSPNSEYLLQQVDLITKAMIQLQTATNDTGTAMQRIKLPEIDKLYSTMPTVAKRGDLLSSSKAIGDALNGMTDNMTYMTLITKEFNEIDVEMPAPSQEDIEAWNTYKDSMDKSKVSAEQLNQALSQLVASGISAFAESIGNMIGSGNTEDALQGFISRIAGLLKSFGSMLIAYGVSLEVLQKSQNPYAMIAAGAALVIIGSAISSSQKSISAAASGTGGSFYGSSYGGGGSFGGGGAIPQTIYLKAQGSDLVAVLNKETSKQYANG